MCCGKRNIVVVHIGGSPIRDSYMVHRCGSHARVRACRNRHDSRAGCNILRNEYRNWQVSETGKCPSAAVAVRILVKANTEVPTVIVDADGYAYNECAIVGSKSLSELIVSHDGTLQWYDAAGNPLGTGASFDTSEAGETTYYASSISADGCEFFRLDDHVGSVGRRHFRYMPGNGKFHSGMVRFDCGPPRCFELVFGRGFAKSCSGTASGLVSSARRYILRYEHRRGVMREPARTITHSSERRTVRAGGSRRP